MADTSVRVIAKGLSHVAETTNAFSVMLAETFIAGFNYSYFSLRCLKEEKTILKHDCKSVQRL